MDFFYTDPVIVHPLEPLKHIGIVFSDEGTYVHILWKYSFASTNVCEYANWFLL